ncbi:VWA domain-containing protein [Humisphaera borealis]|uniref:VWA domain-containing protein n=1 Tax=Humisphaera borealis TaxID=2807512 RepID=A0A7M2WYZ1_9BACT|nr:VWA domain-containing protein [Humisphaera borealis]QOV89700.1 VWA domain-containing protein [Humisphaera borealis]
MQSSNRRCLALSVSLLVSLLSHPVFAAAIELGKTVPVRAETGNRAVAVTIRNAGLADTYGDTKAADGRLFLIISTQWENVLPVKITAENKSIPTGYKIPDLAEHVYLVVDGRKVARVAPATAKLPGHLKTRDFDLPALGDTAKGNLIFDVPKDLALSASQFSLHYYDLTHGHFFVQIAGTPPASPLKPIGIARSNQVMEAGVFAIKRDTELAGRKAPAGMTYVTIDFRAESTFKADADATAFDPTASPGSKIRKAIFTDWAEWQKYVSLLVDGQYAYAVDTELSDLPVIPRLLPEVKTGGSMVFLAPAEAKGTELKLSFPGARSGTQIIRPTAIDLFVDGNYIRPAKRDALLAINDDLFKVAIVGQTALETFADVKPTKGRFLVLDVEVQNTGRQGEFFQVKDQLKLVDEQGAQLAVSDATFAGIRRPTPLVYIPSGEQRAFQVVYDVAAALAKPRLAYAGISMAKVFDLQPIAGAGADPAVAASQPANQPGGGRPATGPAVAGTTTPPVKPITPPQVTKKSELPARVTAKQPAKPMGLAAAGLTPEQVNAAIDRGAAFLWKALEKDTKDFKNGNQFTAQQALMLLALVHSDHHKKNPACDAAVRMFLDGADPVSLGTYAAGVYLMIAEHFGDAMYMPKVRNATRYLIESQGKGGTWGYGGNRDRKFYAETPPDLSDPLSIVGGKPTEGPGSDEAVMTRISKPEAGEDGDNSVTQYAILGLHSAARMGLKIPPELWKKTYDTVKSWQQEDGGFGYHGDRSYGSMTCAGVGTLTLCRYHMGEKEPGVDEIIERGIGWLDVKFSVTQNPENSDSWLYYYLYGMERVGRILDTEYIGDNEWYPFGAKMLVSKQMDDGSWIHTGQEADPPLPTSFALLFLTRATPNLTIAKKEGPGTLKTEVTTPPMNRIYIIMDASGSMLEEMGGRQKFAIAQDAVIALIESLPENSEVALRAYGYRKRAIEKDADLDTALILPMAKLDKKKVIDIVRGLRCRGKTPLATSLTQTAQDLAGAKDKTKPITLVLLTDGGEDTMPRQNPVKAAEAIAKLPGVSFQVVGFDINRQDWSEQLLATARAGNGQYLPAAQADILLAKLQTAIFRTPEQWVISDRNGKEVARGLFGQSAKLSPGQYTVTTTMAGIEFKRQAWVNANSTTVARFDPVKIDFSKAPTTPTATTPVPPPVTPVQPPPVQPPPVQATATSPATAPAAVTPARPKFCTNCGKPLTIGAKFCTNCGAKTGG